MNTQELAYQLWESAGRPEGLDEHFWYEAEKQNSLALTDAMTEQQQQNNKLLNNILDSIAYARDKEYYGKHPIETEETIIEAKTRFIDPELLKPKEPWYAAIRKWWST